MKNQLDINVNDMVLCDHVWYQVLEIDITDAVEVVLYVTPHDGEERELMAYNVEQVDPAVA